MADPYRRLAPYLQERFGTPVHRITLDAGSDCPNRDGTKGFGGCVYCDVDGSGSGYLRTGMAVRDQMRNGLRWFGAKVHATKAIAYLQSYSNTYGSVERLREILEVVKEFRDDVAVLSVATRPDTFPEEAAALLATYREHFPVWVEFGLETGVNETQKRINRLHTVEEYFAAVGRARRFDLEVITHCILGLPGEGPLEFDRTARVIADSHPDGVKIHQLMVLDKTVLASWYREGKVSVFKWSEYLKHLCDFLEQIPEDIVVHRILGDATAEDLIAPRWKVNKNKFRDALMEEFHRRGTLQGAFLPASSRTFPPEC